MCEHAVALAGTWWNMCHMVEYVCGWGHMLSDAREVVGLHYSKSQNVSACVGWLSVHFAISRFVCLAHYLYPVALWAISATVYIAFLVFLIESLKDNKPTKRPELPKTDIHNFMKILEN